MKSGISVRKLEQKGGAKGPRACRGHGKAGKEQSEQSSGGCRGHPALWHCSCRAHSLGSLLVLQEKLWLPAVRSLMLQVLCKTVCFKGVF